MDEGVALGFSVGCLDGTFEGFSERSVDGIGEGA